MTKIQKVKKVCTAALVIICCAISSSFLYATGSPKAVARKWQAHSAECAALCYQSFNSAKQYIASLQRSDNKRRTIILDIDETVISAAFFQEWLEESKNEYSDEHLNLWCKKNPLPAITGAVDFCNFVKFLHIKSA